ncbi:MAG: hypothetical protein ACQSGP_16540 [Frankia sp.]
MVAAPRTSPTVTSPGRRSLSAPVYAVVQFDGEQVCDVVVAFEDAPAADRYATDNRLTDYVVAPIGFRADDPYPTDNRGRR